MDFFSSFVGLCVSGGIFHDGQRSLRTLDRLFSIYLIDSPPTSQLGNVDRLHHMSEYTHSKGGVAVNRIFSRQKLKVVIFIGNLYILN